MDKQLLRIYITAEIKRIRHAIDMGNLLPVAGLAQIDTLEKMQHIFQLEDLSVPTYKISWSAADQWSIFSGKN